MGRRRFSPNCHRFSNRRNDYRRRTGRANCGARSDRQPRIDGARNWLEIADPLTRQ